MRITAFAVLVYLLVLSAACSNPTEPAAPESDAPSFYQNRPGDYVTPSGTCAQIFQLAYGTYNGANAYWQDYYRLYCTIPDATTPTTTTPTPPPTSTPPYVPGRSGGTRTAPNYSRYAIHY